VIVKDTALDMVLKEEGVGKKEESDNIRYGE